VQKGRELLNRKREALIRELFQSARPALDARAQVEERANAAYAAFLEALAMRGASSLETYSWPRRELTIDLELKRIWGIAVPQVVTHDHVRRTLSAREIAGASLGPAAAKATAEFENLVALALDALPKEQLMRRLGVALNKATRQVNTLQLRVEPTLSSELRRVQVMLEERERDERSRLRHVLRRMARQ
jgi:H(+)-transporting ATP synthase subunit D